MLDACRYSNYYVTSKETIRYNGNMLYSSGTFPPSVTPPGRRSNLTTFLLSHFYLMMPEKTPAYNVNDVKYTVQTNYVQ